MKKCILVVLFAAVIPFQVCSGQSTHELKSTIVPAKIDMLYTPQIGGIKQFVEIKTDDMSRPVLLFLSGGPGSSMMNNAGSFTGMLKSRFTIVQWDQRDAGKTLKLNSSPTRPSVEQMEQDTLQVIDFVRKELKQEKIFLLGSSWGNVLGFHVVKTHPEVLHAYFAVNPVVNQLASEKELRQTLMNHFYGNPLAMNELANVNIPFKSDEDLLYLRKWLLYKEGKTNVLSEEFNSDFLHWSAKWSPVWNDVMRVDLSESLTQVECPIYFLVGAMDIQTSTRITQAYFKKLQAPKKELFMFERSGHQIHQDEPEKPQSTILKTLGAI